MSDSMKYTIKNLIKSRKNGNLLNYSELILKLQEIVLKGSLLGGALLVHNRNL